MNHLYIFLANNLTVGGTGDSKETFHNTTLTTTNPTQFHRYSGPVPLDGRFCVLTARQTLKTNTTIYNIKPHSQSFLSSKPSTMSNMWQQNWWQNNHTQTNLVITGHIPIARIGEVTKFVRLGHRLIWGGVCARGNPPPANIFSTKNSFLWLLSWRGANKRK